MITSSLESTKGSALGFGEYVFFNFFIGSLVAAGELAVPAQRAPAPPGVGIEG